MKPIEGLHGARPELHEKLTKQTVVYMTSDQGPFRCDKCDFWVDPNACELVEGVIDPGGCCNDFKRED